jgi:cysteine-rich repeat protein
LSARLVRRFTSGVSLDLPCPRCGRPDQAPVIGDSFACEGGPASGSVCNVDAVDQEFGGTSFECPPEPQADSGEPGIPLGRVRMTTDRVEKTAQLPCANVSFGSNPLLGNGKCTDLETPCSSNDDCRRCAGDSGRPCKSDAACDDEGPCVAWPALPVTCGYWCHCGFCDDDPSQPCFDESDCPAGQACQAGSGIATAANAPQQKPNQCSDDGFQCGAWLPEQCNQTLTQHCELEPQRPCTDDATCQGNNAGACISERLPCFGPRVSREGRPSPLGRYCSTSHKPCRGPIDCAVHEPCLHGVAVPRLEVLACMPATTSSTTNNSIGLTGPSALEIHALIQPCYCGDGVIGCSETCDDGNTVNGDGCDDRCRKEQ